MMIFLLITQSKTHSILKSLINFNMMKYLTLTIIFKALNPDSLYMCKLFMAPYKTRISSTLLHGDTSSGPAQIPKC